MEDSTGGLRDGRRRSARTTGRTTKKGGRALHGSKENTQESEIAVCRRTLGEWLSSSLWTWRYFVTLTYRDERPRSIDYVGSELLDTIPRNAVGGAIAFVSREFGSRSGRLHHHALLHGDAWSLSRTNRDWRSRHGIFHSRPYDKERGGAHYVSRYVLKDAEANSWAFYSRSEDIERCGEVLRKRQSGFERYCQEIEEEKGWTVQVEAKAEVKALDEQLELLSLTGLWADGTLFARR